MRLMRLGGTRAGCCWQPAQSTLRTDVPAPNRAIFFWFRLSIHPSPALYCRTAGRRRQWQGRLGWTPLACSGLCTPVPTRSGVHGDAGGRPCSSAIAFVGPIALPPPQDWLACCVPLPGPPRHVLTTTAVDSRCSIKRGQRRSGGCSKAADGGDVVGGPVGSGAAAPRPAGEARAGTAPRHERAGTSTRIQDRGSLAFREATSPRGRVEKRR